MLNPWKEIVSPPLGPRSVKPRQNGLTMVIDKGLGLVELEDLLNTAGDHLDLLKLGFGTSVLYHQDVLQKKIALCRRYDVQIYPGGTLMEVAFLQAHYKDYLKRARELGFALIEISDGTIDLERRSRRSCIQQAVQEGLLVITEVGKKDPQAVPRMKDLFLLAQEDLAAGAWKVIIEARESGKGIGIYDQSGAVLEEKLEDFANRLDDPGNVIWEAPLKNQQFELIQRFGLNVNLGNIQPNELLSLEALRSGLRSDTLQLVL